MRWLLPSLAVLLSGCDMALMDPKGAVGLEQRSLILTATGLMLIVVIPVFIMTVWFAWRYRAANKQATYAPKWAHSNKIELVVWLVPCIIILILGTITWRTSHSLDPHKPLASDKPALQIDVVALDWKWLFIYPAQGIATVNEIAIPVDVPVHFRITSATVMNSFFIPRLGSQVYAMAGMNNDLYLVANEAGTYKGIAANYSGHGFSGMKFATHAVSDADFAAWVDKVKQAPGHLDSTQYAELVKPSQNVPVTYFSSAKPGLYEEIIQTFMGEMPMHEHEAMPAPLQQSAAMAQGEAMEGMHDHTMHAAATSGTGE
ncbi:ubiquinol oxidase subunit II [Pseudaeromonas sp. ZJS20]|uniref:ubiquinol oxidase subunit II n=1 Tax=Pseudaeromonas aegiceratis TaxID=3153928 RepID=UPI00390C4FD8